MEEDGQDDSGKRAKKKSCLGTRSTAGDEGSLNTTGDPELPSSKDETTGGDVGREFSGVSEATTVGGTEVEKRSNLLSSKGEETGVDLESLGLQESKAGTSTVDTNNGSGV